MTLRYTPAFYRLPIAAWKFVELKGNVVRSSTYAPITSRDKPREIASLELLQRLSEEYNKIHSQHDEVQHWLKQKEEEYECETRITVRGMVPSSLLRLLTLQ